MLAGHLSWRQAQPSTPSIHTTTALIILQLQRIRHARHHIIHSLQHQWLGAFALHLWRPKTEGPTCEGDVMQSMINLPSKAD
jgi:hypothetical protein